MGDLNRFNASQSIFVSSLSEAWDELILEVDEGDFTAACFIKHGDQKFDVFNDVARASLS